MTYTVRVIGGPDTKLAMNDPIVSSSPSTPSEDADVRLGSWKEIAAYLGRDVRTVQRWEQTQALPVHRHRHSRLSTAYAYKSELDEWWHNRSTTGEPRPEPPDSAPAAAPVTSKDPVVQHAEQGPAEPRKARRSSWYWKVGAVGAAATVALGLYGWLTRPGEDVALPFHARDFVLITAFENRTGDALFDGTVEYALARELSNSTFVNVVPAARVQDTLELMRRAPNTPLDKEIGREVALRDGGIRVVLAGRAERFGTRYTLTADILRATDGVVAASLHENAAGETEVLPAIQRLAMQTRRRLGESLTQVPAATSLPRVTTSSLRALQLYAKAWDSSGWNENAPVNQAASLQLLRQAIEIDPEFAAAHIRIATLSSATTSLENRIALLPHVDRAVAAARGAPETERLLIDAEADLFRAASILAEDGVAQRQAYERAIAALEATLHLQPDHYVAVAKLISAKLSIGDRTRARELAERYADLRPTSAAAQLTAARNAIDHADAAAARRYVDRARSLGVPLTHLPPTLAVWLGLFDATEAWLAGDANRALALTETFSAEAAAYPAPLREPAAAQLFFTYLSLGRLKQADSTLDAQLAAFDPLFRDQQRGRVIALRGDRRALAAFFDKHFPTPERARFVASNLMDAGNLELAKRVLDYHQEHRSLEGYDWYAGQMALLEGRHDEAIRRLDVAAKFFAPFTNQGLKIARQLADAHRAAGRLDHAVRLLEQATAARGELAHAWEWLRSRDRLSALYREAGRVDDAERVDRELTALLVVADDDHAIKRRLVQQGIR